MRRATPTSTSEPQVQGDPAAALASAKRVIEAEYEVPFQGHTAIGPAHALADPSDGQMTIYSNDMKSYGLRNGVAKFLDMPREKVRVVYMDGPQVYGRTAADDAGFEAAFLAKELGRPVRMQWMRDEETAWDTKGPPYVFKLRGGLDDQGKLVALEYDACAADHNHLGYNEPDTVLIAQLMGRRPERPARGSAEAPSVMYAIANRRTTTRVVGLPMIWETPLRTGNLRDPNGPQVTFAFESFIDELAAAAKADPVQFRLDMLEAGQRRWRVPQSALARRGACRCEGLWMGRAPVTETTHGSIAWQTALRTRHRLHLPQQHHCRRHRRGRSESRDRACLGQAHGVRPRLRARDQSRRPASHRRVRHVARAESCALGRGPVRYRESHQCRLGFTSQPATFGHARDNRHRAGQRRSQSGPPRPAALRRGRMQPQTRDRRGCQRDLRCNGGSIAPSAIPQRTGVGGIEGGEYVERGPKKRRRGYRAHKV